MWQSRASSGANEMQLMLDEPLSGQAGSHGEMWAKCIVLDNGSSPLFIKHLISLYPNIEQTFP